MDNIITVTAENIGHEHICCAITDKKGETCVSSKKTWMKERFGDGLVFRKLDVRGKAFIEYIPAEKAWCPIDAPGYIHINCFWVSGRFTGKGYANRLLDVCIEDAKVKGRCGLTVVASEKKRPFLSDPDYLKHKGFSAADTAKPFFILYYLPFTENAPVPRFKECAKQGETEGKGMVLYYTSKGAEGRRQNRHRRPLYSCAAYARAFICKLFYIYTTQQNIFEVAVRKFNAQRANLYNLWCKRKH